MKTKTAPLKISKYLDSNEQIIAYLKVAREEGILESAIDNVIEALTQSKKVIKRIKGEIKMTQATEKDIGKWCKFWDNETSQITIDKLVEICNGFIDKTDAWDYDNCIPLTQEQIQVLGLEV